LTITCTTIHGFCQQLIKPYPVEAGIDPGATTDPAAADLAYQDLMGPAVGPGARRRCLLVAFHRWQARQRR
jgi:hypothetical protein